MQPSILTLQPHQLIVAFLAQLQFPPVLAKQFLVVAINLLDGLANLGSMHTAVRGLVPSASLHWPPGLMTRLPSPAQAEYPTHTITADRPLPAIPLRR